MGVYRYWCETMHEVTWLLELVFAFLKKPRVETNLSFDQQVNMWCISIHDISTEEDLPF